MADERVGIEIAASATGVDATAGQVARLKDQIAAFKTILGSMSAGSPAFTSLTAQVQGLEAQLNRLSSSYIKAFAGIESFNIRAIAAMRGQADAIRGVAREMGELDRITRAGAGRVAYGAVDPAALRIAAVPTAASHRVMQAELDAAFGATAEQKVGRTAAAITGVGRSSTTATKEVRHLAAEIGELSSGRHGQFISSLSASLRDAGLSATGLSIGLGALVGVSVVAGFERMAASAGELAEKTLNAAEASGVAVEKFTQLRTIMAIQSGDTNSLPRALGLLQSHAEEALTNPFSGAAAGFGALGIGTDQLKEGLKDPIALLEKLREEYQKLGPAAAEAMRLALGRAGFQELASYLRLTSEEMANLSQRADATGRDVDEKFLQSLAKAGVQAHEFGQAIEGLRDHLAALAGESGLTTWLTHQTEELSHAADGWRMYFEHVQKANSGITPPIFTGTEDMVGAGTFGSLVTGSGAYSDTLAKAAAQYKIPPELLSRVIASESDFNPNVKTSSAGAVGIAQFLPSTAKQYGFDPSDPNASIYGAAHYLSDLHGQRGSWTGALTGYLGGDPNRDPSYTKHGAAQLAGQLDRGGVAATATLPPPIPTAGDLYQPEQARRDLEIAQRKIEEERRLKDSEYQLRIDRARQGGKNEQEIQQIETEKANYDKQQADAITKLHQDAAAKAQAAGAQPAVVQTFQEGAGASQVQANTAAGAAINAQTAANQQAYQQQREQQQNAIEDAKVAADQILNSAKATTEEKISALKTEEAATKAHYASIIALAKQYGQQQIEGSRTERAERQAVLEIENKIAQVKKEGVSAAMSEASSGDSMLQSQLRTLQAQIETEQTLARAGQGKRGGGLFGGGGESAMVGEYQKEAQLTQAIAAEQESNWQKIASDANASSAQVQKAEAMIAEIRAKATQEEAQDFEKAYQAYQKAHEGLMNFLSSLGSGFQSFSNSLIKAIFSPQVDIIHAGLTTIRTNERSQEIRQAIGQLLLHGVQSAVDSVESAVGNVLKNWLSQAFTSMGAPAIGNFLGTGATSAATAATTTTPIVTAITAQTSALTASQTASTTAIVTAINTSAAVQAAVPKPFGFSGGGIVPSAAGGMVVGGIGGGVLSILHPQEMVLPANISQGMQRLISGGGSINNSRSVTYAPQINSSGGGMSRPEFSQMLAGHKDDIVGMLRQDMRGGWRP